MKSLFLKSIMMGSVALIFACNRSEKPALKPVTESIAEAPLPLSSIPLDTGVGYIKMYRNYCKQRSIPHAFQGASIARADLLGVLGIDTLGCSKSVTFAFTRARAYVGYNPASGDFHLLFTPIFEDGSIAGKDSILIDSDGARIVYDLTTPCPNTCDFSSPLYKAFVQY